MTRSTAIMLLCFLVAPSAAGQYQASNRSARRCGLQVSEMTRSPSEVRLRVEGPVSATGMPYLLMMQFDATADKAYAHDPGLTLPLIEPLCLDYVSSASVTGSLPPDGVHTLNLPLSPEFDKKNVHWQFFLIDPVGSSGISVSNGTRRLRTNTVPRSDSPYRDDHMLSPGDPDGFLVDKYQEIEQADVDGDGDPDTLLVSCDGDLVLLRTEVDALDPIAHWISSVTGATAAEFADINNDNWMDLVVAVARAPGVEVYLNNGFGGSGQWAQFTRLPSSTIALDPVVGLIPHPADVETADMDQDGYLDLVLACASDPDVGEENRLLRNALGDTGTIGFTDVTVAALNRTDPYEPFLDETEDVELADLDCDGDYDIVFGNYRGPPATKGIEYVYVNEGGAQGGTAGTFARQTIIADDPEPPADETLDVMVADLNDDGSPDIYVGNYVTESKGLPVADRLYLTDAGGNCLPGAGPLSWVERSELLPDNENYTGGPPVPALPTTDVEFVDLGRSPQVCSIVVSSGLLCPGSDVQLYDPAIATGVRHLFHPWPDSVFFNIVDAFPSDLQVVPVRDIETGDWQAIFPDLDLGLATYDSGVSSGMIVLLR